MPGEPRPPNPTVGQHFGSLLLCPQRTWLDYHGDRRLKASPPGFLGRLQQEGLAHEREVYQKYFPDAVRIPTSLADEQRAAMTIEAMRQGVPAIIQAFFMTSAGRGVADVAELAGKSAISKTGHLYRIGEIKSAAAISTAHALQVAWYHELLQDNQGAEIHDAFFILRDSQRQTISIADVKTAFDDCKAELLRLRDQLKPPGPHLCRWCASCPWRDVCLPELVAHNDLSLLPGISRRQADLLRTCGANSWQEVFQLDPLTLAQAGIAGSDLLQLGRARERLQNGAAVLHREIRNEQLRGLRVFAVEFDERAGEQLHPDPTSVWFETESGIQQIELHGNADWAEEVALLVQSGGVALYGAIESVSFLKLLKNAGLRPPRYLDVLDLVENLVHAPLRGLDLQSVLEQAAPHAVHATGGRDRVLGLRAVINWIAGLPQNAA